MRDLDALFTLLESRARTPFAWGSDAHDCCSFAGAAIEAQTGDNALARFGHTWSTARGAARVLRRMGGLAAAVDTVLTRLEGPAFAHRGDIGLVAYDGREHLGVIEGSLVVCAGPDGLIRHPRELVTIAWSVEQGGGE